MNYLMPHSPTRDIQITKTGLLSKLNFPEKLKNVPSYAGSHHESIDGTGYPSKLKGDQIPLPGRMMAIVDIWEAVTAPDRPYRPPANDKLACKIIREEAANGKSDYGLRPGM